VWVAVRRPVEAGYLRTLAEPVSPNPASVASVVAICVRLFLVWRVAPSVSPCLQEAVSFRQPGLSR